MIDRQLANAARVLAETFSLAEERGTVSELLPDLMPLFAVGLVHVHRQLLLYCLDLEADWPWND